MSWPSGSFRGFPEVEIDTTVDLYRIHREARSAEFYAASRDGRFNPPVGREDEFGTCYLGVTALGAFVETLGRLRVVPDYLVAQRRLSVLRTSRAMRVADLTDPRVLGRFGIAGDLSVGSDYSLPQAWAAALFDAGFDGVRYVTRHDPSMSERSIALFGPPGDEGRQLVPTKPDGTPIPDDVIDEAARHFEIYVVPTSGPR